MKHNLEAFLIQSAYVEGLLKYIGDFHLFSQTDGKSHEGSKLLIAIKKDIEKYSFSNLIDLLKRGEVISFDQKKLLDEYRRKRNTVLHDLLRQVTSKNFEEDLLIAYNLGEKITDSAEFKDMEKFLDKIETDIDKELTTINTVDSSASTEMDLRKNS